MHVFLFITGYAICKFFCLAEGMQYACFFVYQSVCNFCLSEGMLCNMHVFCLSEGI